MLSVAHREEEVLLLLELCLCLCVVMECLLEVCLLRGHLSYHCFTLGQQTRVMAGETRCLAGILDRWSMRETDVQITHTHTHARTQGKEAPPLLTFSIWLALASCSSSCSRWSISLTSRLCWSLILHRQTTHHQTHHHLFTPFPPLRPPTSAPPKYSSWSLSLHFPPPPLDVVLQGALLMVTLLQLPHHFTEKAFKVLHECWISGIQILPHLLHSSSERDNNTPISLALNLVSHTLDPLTHMTKPRAHIVRQGYHITQL